MTKPSECDETAELELRALRAMIRARCKQIELQARKARSRGGLASREAELQLEVFEERQNQAIQQITNDTSEPTETRIARLERTLEALGCSQDYFCPETEASPSSTDMRDWAIMVK